VDKLGIKRSASPAAAPWRAAAFSVRQRSKHPNEADVFHHKYLNI
jgi:hypothetical protein